MEQQQAEIALSATDNASESMPVLEQKKLEARERGSQFITWLTNGLADGSISINNSNSPVHFVEQGMILVTPAIFRDYAGGIFNKYDPESLGPLAQKGFEALKIHQRKKRGSLYRMFTNNGTNKQLFYCYLIPEHNIKHFIQPSSRPANNTEITLENDTENNLLTLEQQV